MNDKRVICRCKFCGKTFLAGNGTARVCSDPECKKKQEASWRKETKHYISKPEPMNGMPRKHRKTTEEEWRAIIRGMEESGLTYGQFVARYNK